MSEQIEPVEITEQAETVQEPVTEPSAPTPAGELSTSTKIGSMAELREKAPEVYKKMMEGLATSMINEMRRRQDRLKELMREWRYRSGIR